MAAAGKRGGEPETLRVLWGKGKVCWGGGRNPRRAPGHSQQEYKPPHQPHQPVEITVWLLIRKPLCPPCPMGLPLNWIAIWNLAGTRAVRFLPQQEVRERKVPEAALPVSYLAPPPGGAGSPYRCPQEAL